jgi:hypothetical protein
MNVFTSEQTIVSNEERKVLLGSRRKGKIRLRKESDIFLERNSLKFSIFKAILPPIW